jgi:O-acetyl-ADP-ribose deacetylase (regulator of RNase III)
LPKPGAAASPTFSQTANGPFVSQTAYVYPKVTQALTYWHRVVTPRLSSCVAGSLTASSTQTVQFKVTRKRSLALPAIADRRAGYRVIGVASTTAQEITVYLDMIVVGRGSGLTQVSFTTFSQPPSRSLELRLARLVAGRLPADSGASKA